MYDYLSGFDDNSPAAKRRPGIAILLAMMDEAFARGIGVIDFLRGDEPYKFEMTAAVNQNINIRVCVGTPKSAAGSAAANIARYRSLSAFLARREWILLNVQLKERAFPASLYHYAVFRAGRFVRKFMGSNPPPAGA